MESPTERSPSAPHTAEVAQPAETSGVLPPDVLNAHLSYPAPSEPPVPQASSSSSSTQTRTILKDRLYVGNLHPTVDEYALLQLFSKFGKVSKLDYLFHKAGPLKGKPRGYAFVEYANRDDAEKALAHAHDKLVRGRKLVVTFANQAPLDAAGAQGPGSKYRRPVSDVGKPTTLSLLKSAGAGRSNATDAKIARMEAKLRQLESSAAAAAAEGSGSSSSAGAGASLPGHPSLPPKPVAGPIIPAARHAPTSTAPSASAAPRDKSRARPLPILPIKPSIQTALKPAATPLVASSTSTPSPPRAPPTRKTALSGVRIVKSKPNKSSG